MPTIPAHNASVERPSSLRLAVVITASVLGAALMGVVFPPDEWYASLSKPSWNPPNAIFGPVWSVLYVMIGWLGFRIWKDGHTRHLKRLWIAQMALNAAWTPAFFGLHSPELALAVIVGLFTAITLLARQAQQETLASRWMMAPYWLWVAFATSLNAAIAWMNP
jgi:tryptophan-rich sensory protein